MSLPRILARLLAQFGTVRPLQKRVHRAFYDLLATHFRADAGWYFMNYGLDTPYFREHPLTLRPEDEPERPQVQLYHHLLATVPVAGARVLDIGCGRGGGAAYVQRCLGPKRTVAIDLSERTLRICATHCEIEDLDFIAGDAERLPFKDTSFDIIINVESCHAYASIERFVDEVSRVLRVGGFLVCADLRWLPVRSRPDRQAAIGLLTQQFARGPLALVSQSDLSSAVLEAMTRSGGRRQALIRQQVPRALQSAFAELAGLPGTYLYDSLSSGRLGYWSAVLQKSGPEMKTEVKRGE